MTTHAQVTLRASPFGKLSFAFSVRAIGVLWCAAILTSGCTRVASVKWQSPQTPTYQEVATLQVTVKSGLFSHPDLDAMLEDNGTLAVLSKTRRTIDPSTSELTFEVVPLKPGRKLNGIVRYGIDRSSSHRFTFDVDMPTFSGRSNASFLEMIEAPDTSIYGAHITYWPGLGTQYVSGHAASNICRKVSAAVMDFAISRALIDDDFFVGAGFASLPEDTEADDRLTKQLQALPHPESVEEVIEDIEDAGDAHGAYDLADVLDDPGSYRPRPAGAERFAQIVRSEAIDSNVAEIAGWIEDPERAIGFLGEDFGLAEVINDVKAMPQNQRHDVAYSLRKYAALLNSEDLLRREVKDVAGRSGLVRSRQRQGPRMDTVAAAVRAWHTQATSGREVALRTLTSSTDPFSAAGEPAGLVFLPFVDATTGKDVVFDLPKALFVPPQSADKDVKGTLLDMLRKSVSHEMISNLEDAAKRQDEQYHRAVTENLAGIREEFARAGNPGKWLHETRTVTYTIVDDFGRPTGRTETRQITNFKFWVERLEFAEDSHQQSVLYAQSARRIRESQDDPKSAAIHDGTLLDSFLRGWDLAFVDNSNESPYHNWLASNRNAVWSEIFRQATQRGIDLAPLVSEQTVFQVRSNGDQYHIRPMYVGDAADTAVKSDGRLIFYRSPWMQRQVVYLARKDVEQGAWSKANTQFNPEKPDPALETLADDLLSTALNEENPERQLAGVRRAMAVDAQHVANQLISDYWSFWDEGTEGLSEQTEFELALLSDQSDKSLESSLGVKVNDKKFDRYIDYVTTRAFEGGLKVVRCLGTVANSVEDDHEPQTPAGDEHLTKETRSARDADVCFEKVDPPEQTALADLELDKVMDEVRKALASSAANWHFDALGRSAAAGELDDGLGRVIQPLLVQSTKAIRQNPTKRAVESYIRLQWYSGDFLAALNMTLRAVQLQAQAPQVAERARLLSRLQMEILKALVYSGVQLRSAGEPKLSMASLSRTDASGKRALFGIRKSDFVMRPESIDHIAYRITVPEGLQTANRQVEGTLDSITPLPEFVRLSPEQSASILHETPAPGDAGVGIETPHGAGSLTKTIWMRDANQVHAASFSDLLDQNEHSQVIKVATVDPTTATRCVELLRANGFELLQGKDLKEGFHKAVILSYPDQVVVLAGDESLRLAPPAGAKDVPAAVRTAFERGNVRLADLSADNGLLQEARYIVGQQLDASTYFSGTPFPGMVAFARDGTQLRMVLREPDGNLASYALENGQLHRMSNGAAAIADIESLERTTLEAHSDARVEFVHTSTFLDARGATVHMQVGKLSRDVPLEELHSLLTGNAKPTPVLDQLFVSANGAEKPTFVVYRDALVRGAGGGGKPPGNIRVTTTSAEPPDPDRTFMIGAYDKDRGHVPPIPLLLGLKEKYPGVRFKLDDALDLARANALEPILIGAAKEVAAYLPVKSFRVTQYGAITNIRKELEGAGVHVETSMKALAERNVLVISGHKDQALQSYIDAHIKAGNFKGKQIVLFSCYQEGDANLAHRIVSEGGAKEVVFFSQEIKPEAVNAVVGELAETLKTMDAVPPEHKQLIDVLDASIESALHRGGMTDPARKDVAILRGRVPQISAIFRGNPAPAA